ncbi:hypothetical protein HDE_01258 [Halotydeus destructor]|nr:hypothetical protein HDE_01258 [Halotydeus destructor]
MYANSPSLSDLCDDLIRKVLHSVPSVQRLVHFEFTDRRFKSLVECHMKTMSTVDFRYENETDTFNEMLRVEFISKRFSPQLTQAIFRQHHKATYHALIDSHPQLFPRNIRTSRRLLMSDKNRYRPDRVTRFYEAVYCDWYASDSVSVGLHHNKNMYVENDDLQYWHEFVANLKDSKCFKQDLSSVQMITLSPVAHDLPKYTFLLSQYFIGLTELTLNVYPEISVSDALHLRHFMIHSGIKVHLHFVSRHGLAGDCQHIIGEYVLSYKTIMDSNTPIELSSLSNLQELVISFDKYCDICTSMPCVPMSLKVVELECFTSEHLILTSSLIDGYGHQLHELRIRFGPKFDELQGPSEWDIYRHLIGDEVKEMRRVLEAIALKCPNLKVLGLDVSAPPLTYRDSFVHLMESVGGNLTQLWLRPTGLSDEVRHTIFQCCTCQAFRWYSQNGWLDARLDGES